MCHIVHVLNMLLNLRLTHYLKKVITFMYVLHLHILLC